MLPRNMTFQKKMRETFYYECENSCSHIHILFAILLLLPPILMTVKKTVEQTGTELSCTVTQYRQLIKYGEIRKNIYISDIFHSFCIALYLG